MGRSVGGLMLHYCAHWDAHVWCRCGLRSRALSLRLSGLLLFAFQHDSDALIGLPMSLMTYIRVWGCLDWSECAFHRASRQTV